MGSCGVTKRSRPALTTAASVDMSRGIMVSPGQFVLESTHRFVENYSIGKRLGGGATVSITLL